MTVSIITVVFNNCHHVENAIRSVLSQTYKDIEYIVVDGGSTDETMDIIRKYSRQISKVISEKDQGIYDALNKGLSIASGDLIGILHSDDIFFNNSVVDLVVNQFNECELSLVYGKGVYVNRFGKKRIMRIYGSSDFRYYKLFFGWIPLHTTIFVKREMIERLGLYDLRYSISSDYDISLRWFLDKSVKKRFLNQYMVIMNLGGKSTTPALQRKKSSQDLLIIKRHRLLGVFTLLCKILRKLPQYVKPFLYKERILTTQFPCQKQH